MPSASAVVGMLGLLGASLGDCIELDWKDLYIAINYEIEYI
jgi:hypothetical protein